MDVWLVCVCMHTCMHVCALSSPPITPTHTAVVTSTRSSSRPRYTWKGCRGELQKKSVFVRSIVEINSVSKPPIHTNKRYVHIRATWITLCCRGVRLTKGLGGTGKMLRGCECQWRRWDCGNGVEGEDGGGCQGWWLGWHLSWLGVHVRFFPCAQYTKIHTFIYSYTHTYTHTYIHTYIHACMHAYIHTHTHTNGI